MTPGWQTYLGVSLQVLQQMWQVCQGNISAKGSSHQAHNASA